MGRPRKRISRRDLVDRLRIVTNRLIRQVGRLTFAPPVSHVYDPLVYARAGYDEYVRRYVNTGVTVLLGMNPGPFGMAQTGIPFGEVGVVRDWLRIRERTGRPAVEHPRRPVLGLECGRSEVSGLRLWGWARERYGTPARFFRRFLILNYCPLCFMESSGRNRTPDHLPSQERAALFAACDTALRASIEVLGGTHVVGIGRFAAARAGEALAGSGVVVSSAPHPSPASPAANRGWMPLFERALRVAGVEL